ncbi:MAG: IS200/IS605 family transposase [Bacteroidetes bacterium]|nr:IS200/IS605 family transposase [Bacteroidota bacterium]
MSEHIHKSHNKSLLLYHLVCPIKYRRSVLSESVERSLIEVCKNIANRYEIHFVEIGADENHVHFLIQSVPMLSVKSIAQTVKSITAKELFRLHPEVKEKLWGGNFWTAGYYVNTVGQYANEDVILKYIQNQGETKSNYKMLHKNQLSIAFE